MDQIKGVFFDLGGTLRIARQDAAHQQRARARMAQLAGRGDVDAFMDEIDRNYAGYRQWAIGRSKEAGDYELWAKWLLPQLPQPRLQEICHEMTYQYRQVSGLRQVVEGGLTVIRALKARGFRLGIVSNLIGENEIADWLRQDGLDGYFDAVVLSSVCHIRKPDPAIFRMACDQLRLAPGQCASIADKLNRDIAGGIAAGLGANIWYTSPEKAAGATFTAQNRPDYIVHRFVDVLDLPPLQKGGEGA